MREPPELAAALRTLGRPPRFGDVEYVQAAKLRSQYREETCCWCMGSGHEDADRTKGPCRAVGCEGVGKVWVKR